MIRNIDLPECVIFYGSDSILLSSRGVDGGSSASSSFALRPGVTRLLAECAEVGTPALLLSEHRRADDLRDVLLSAVTNADDDDGNSEGLSPFLQDGTLVVKSSLEGCTFAPDHPYSDDDDNDQAYLYGPNNHAPSPGFLLDTVETTAMVPLGFGGSSGFGIKQEGVERRPPLSKFCVVLVSGPDRRPTERDDSSVDVEAVAASVDGAVIKSDTVSRARCTAAKLAGMRVLYLEPEGMGTSDAEDLADAIVTGLGSDDDWEVVRLDDIATPGSYWLNPPVGKDEAGNRVNLVALCNAFQQARSCGLEGAETQAATSSSSDSSGGEERMSEDEMASILADLVAL